MVTSTRREEFRLDPVLRFEAHPMDSRGKVPGTSHRYPLPPHIADRIITAGESIPAVFSSGASADDQLGAML